MQRTDELALNFTELPSEIILREIFSKLELTFVSAVLGIINKQFSTMIDTFYWRDKIEKHFPNFLVDGPYNQSTYIKIETHFYPRFTLLEKKLVRLIKENNIEAIENFPIMLEMWECDPTSSTIIKGLEINNPPLLSCLHKISFAAALKSYTKENGELDHLKSDKYGRTILYWALFFERNIETLLQLTNHNSFNELYFNQYQLFHYAIVKGRLDFIEALFNNDKFNDSLGSLLEQRDRHGQTPLILAARHNHSEIVSFFLNLTDYKAFTDQAHDIDYGKTAFYWLVALGNLAMVKIFIEQFPHLLTEKNIFTSTALMWAAAAGHVPILKYFLLLGADPDIRIDYPNHLQNGKTAFHLAVRNNHLEIVKIFIENFPQLLEERDIFGEVPLIWAAKYYSVSLLKYFLDEGANPNVRTQRPDHENDYRSALYWACENRSSKMVKILIKAGAIDNHEYDADKFRMLHFAVIKGNLDLVKALIETIPDLHYIASVNRSIQTAKDYLIQDLATRKYKIKDLANLINQKDAYGRTPLLWAAKTANFAVVKYLLEKGANPNILSNSPNASTEHNKSALYWAYSTNNTEAIALLMSYGADASVLYNEGVGILHLATLSCELVTIKTIIENDPKYPMLLEQEDLYSQTALLLAAAKGYMEIVKYFLSLGANPNVASKHPTDPNHRDNGKTAIHWAHERQYFDIVAILFKATGGKIIDFKGMSSLQIKISLMNYAIRTHDLALIKLLVKNNENKNELLNPNESVSMTPLLQATILNSSIIVEYLLKRGANPNVVSISHDGKFHRSETPLYWATKNGLVNLVTILMKYGADRSLPGRKSEETAIEVAVDQRDDELVKALIENNHQPFNLDNPYDQRAFTSAVKIDATTIVQLLLSKMKTEFLYNLDKLRNVLAIVPREKIYPALSTEEEVNKFIQQLEKLNVKSKIDNTKLAKIYVNNEAELELAIQFLQQSKPLSLTINNQMPTFIIHFFSVIAPYIPYVVELKFYDCLLNDLLMKGLANLFLGPRSSLLTLEFWNVPCDLPMMMHLSDGIQNNSSLKELFMCDCQIDAEGAAALANMLIANQSLSSLQLPNNYIGDLGASYLCLALSHPKTLLSILGLSKNNIGSHGGEKLLKSLEHNVSLQKLLLFGNVIHPVTDLAIDQCLARNRSIQFYKRKCRRTCYSSILLPGLFSSRVSGKRSNSNENDNANLHLAESKYRKVP